MALLAWIIVPLLLLVAVPHELGHLLMARRFGVTVREFGLGLPPRAFSVTWNRTRWSVNWLLPFGAFVKLKGEDAGTECDDFAALGPGRRSLVVLAGPLANFLVAGVALLLSGVLVGQPTGLRPVATPGGETHLQMAYAPLRTPDDLLQGARALTAASEHTPSVGSQPAMLGWVGLAQVMHELQDVDIPALAWFLALLASLSLGLGVMNLLPIPPLDGGRLFLYAAEAWRQRPLVAPRLMSRLNLAGLAVLVAVFAAVTSTDVLRLLSGQSILAIH